MNRMRYTPGNGTISHQWKNSEILSTQSCVLVFWFGICDRSQEGMPKKPELDSTFLLWNPGNIPFIRSHESKLSAFGSAHLVEDSYESLRFKVSTSRWKRLFRLFYMFMMMMVFSYQIWVDIGVGEMRERERANTSTKHGDN